MWKQTKTPNLDPVIYQGGKVLYNWLGYCLAYVQTAFGAGWSGSSAWDGWVNRTSGKHADRNIPKGVYVPIWFDGYWNGNRYGHVLIAKFNANGSGTAWTSPRTSKPYADVINFSSLSDLEVKIRNGWGSTMKFVGWSEFVGSTRVIQYVNNNATEAQVKALYLEILERPADAGGIATYTKKTYDFVRNDLLKSNERKKLLAKKEADRKKAEEAAKKAEAARIAAEKAAEDKRKAEAAAKAKAEAERLAEIERKKKEEQAAQAPSWKDLAEEQKTTNTLLTQLINLIKSIFNLGGK